MARESLVGGSAPWQVLGAPWLQLVGGFLREMEVIVDFFPQSFELMNKSIERCKRRGRGAAKEINIVSGSAAALLAMMMTSGEVKRLCRDRLDGLTESKKENEKDRCAISKPGMTKCCLAEF